MLYAFGFEKVGVAVSDLYFVDPNPGRGQEGAEQGVRLEVRVFERTELRGSIYSAQPIEVTRSIWRVDLLESVENPGSFDRAHHHPRFKAWEPGSRKFVPELSADPLGWLDGRLARFDEVLADAGVEEGAVDPADIAGVREAAPEILRAVRSLLDGVRGGRLGQPTAEHLTNARIGWL